MMELFKHFLTAKGRIQDRYLPFYLRWVTDCYHFLDIPLSKSITNKQKSQFLKHLGKSHEDWQVNQADYALRLYSYFLSQTSSDENWNTPATIDNDWKAIEEKTIEAIRLCHRSYSMEWGWFWLFPSRRLSIDPKARIVRRHHLYPSALQRPFKEAVTKAGITKDASIL